MDDSYVFIIFSFLIWRKEEIYVRNEGVGSEEIGMKKIKLKSTYSILNCDFRILFFTFVVGWILKGP